MRWLRTFLHPTSPSEAPLPCPKVPVCIIADIHGRLDLLEAMLARIATQPDATAARIIFVGDLIDRGPESASVLARVHALHKANPNQVTCLMGNHERMMLDFLEDAARAGPRWIRNGGSETLSSFGLSPWARRQEENALQALAEALRAALSAELLEWLTTLPLIWQEDLLAVTHAGADPKRAMKDQSPERMLWGPRRREAALRKDGIWVVQGHVIVQTAHAQNQRIWVDTGAWRNGQLSAAWIDADGLSFLNVSGEK